MHNRFPVEPGNCDITKFFKFFSVVQHLKLDDGSLKLFAAGAGGVPRRLPFDLISVESLHLSDIFLDALDVVGDCFEDYIPALECLEVEGFSGVTFSRLREVKLIGDLATEPGIQLVKLLLAKSPVLERMLIETWINDDTAEQLIQSLGKTYGLDVVLANFHVHHLMQKLSATLSMITVWIISCNEAYDMLHVKAFNLGNNPLTHILQLDNIKVNRHFTKYFFGDYCFKMSPKGVKRGCQTAPLDILCSLPENLIDDILMHLPLRDVVRTSILSKKWRYNWRNLPELTLDLTNLSTTEDLIPPKFEFANIIYHVLTLHTGPVTKFCLSFSSNLIPCPSIDNLIYFLSRNGIQHLVLKLPSSGGPYTLPSSLFTCFRLKHLTLQNCLMLPPPSFKGFEKLISLELRDVTISSKSLESLISHCLLLEQLYIPLLAELSVVDLEWNGGKQKCDIAKYFESFTALEHLKLDIDSLRFLAAGGEELPTRLPFDLNSVKSLCLDYTTPALKSLEVEAFSDVTFNHLREVKLTGSIGSEPEMQLIKLLLAKSPVLARMLIKSYTLCYDADEALKISTLLNS
ncbi:F-box/FBD/LRR-repeat protein At1g13570-like [Nicotiana sylvestris]|uniref:F-box/FBD/LRR-repeat protein At1g13570-like n=1 Tax=Nicotiana sylvestris TaxID=4096 RepID=UPI00388C9107